MKRTDLAWLAGILEGEGYFGVVERHQDGRVYCSWRITMSSTDEDVIQRVADLMETVVQGPYQRPAPSIKPNWVATQARREKAIALARRLCPFMSQRRQAQINTMLLKHDSYQPRKEV